MPAITIESLPTLLYEQLMQAATLHSSQQKNLTQRKRRGDDDRR